uniref:ZSWIM1/3 RNaseH-like domain-containing protein n=1 Tax=Clytia hemisphaerica TaxID=252671 RepID=A0A7M5UYK0_9CNID
KIVRLQMSSESGKVVTMRDVHNLAYQTKKEHQNSRNDLEEVIKILKEEFGCSVTVNHNENDEFLGMFFQDKSMKLDFANFPEILFLDATFKLNELRLPAYIFLVEDSMGQSEVVGVALMVNETKENLTWLIETFKKENPADGLRVVMADKDINERNRITEILNVPTLICLFHALKTFKRELSNLSLNSVTKENAKIIFQNLCYAQSKEAFDDFQAEFMAIECPKLRQYYVKNWKPISNEWVKCFKAEYGNFLNSTNNRLESINSKLKSVIGHRSSLEEFVRDFFTVLSSLRADRDLKVANEFLKARIETPSDPNIQAIRSHLTSYSADFVCEELSAIGKTDVRNSTIDSCRCHFYNSMRLPCRHIFLSRSIAKCDPLFDKSLCENRWSKKYFVEHQRLFTKQVVSSGTVTSITSPSRPLKSLNQNERYRTANNVCKSLASLASETGGTIFNERISQLKALEEIWLNGEEFRILTLTKSSQTNVVKSDPKPI